MDAIAAALDQLHDFIDAHLARVVDFQGATGIEAAIVYGENRRPEQRSIAAVERTVDKDAGVVVRSRGGCRAVSLASAAWLRAPLGPHG